MRATCSLILLSSIFSPSALPNIIFLHPNGLPLHIKLGFLMAFLYNKRSPHNAKQFRLALSVFLHSQSSYILDKYFNQENLLRQLLPRCIN